METRPSMSTNPEQLADPTNRGESITSRLLPRFLLRTEARLESMSALLNTLARQQDDREALHELKRHFHALAGLGGTFGFPTVTSISRAAEQACNEIVATERSPSRFEVAHWTRTLDELCAAFVAVPDTALQLVASPQNDISASALLIGSSEQLLAVARELKHEGVDTTIVSTPLRALSELAKAVPDLLIADTQLEESAAYRIVEQLRSLPESETCLALLVGSVSTFDDKVEAVRCGADAHFDLPLQRPALMRRAKQMIETLRHAVPRVLYVEDDPDHASYVSGVLQSSGHEVRVCSDPSAFENELVAFRPDLVLMDVHFSGEVSGYDLARYMRQDERYATTPLLFLTTEAESDARLKSIKAGGDDFLAKPAPAPLLQMAVSSRIERARILKTLLERDGLTGLLTHSALLERARIALSEAERRPEEQKALVMLDIDHFKNVNDRHGHPTGDRVLASLGALLRRRLRQTDAIGRYGGEEFAIVLHHLSEGEAVALIERLLFEFRSTEHSLPGGEKLHVSFSAGVAMVDPSEEIDSWKKRADDALYVAKRNGRNQVVAAGSPLPKQEESVH
jgi:diguanylate cyclase (GGDEF)-like protein